MKATFFLHYKAIWGQSVFLFLYKNKDEYVSCEMFCKTENEWSVSIDFEPNEEEIHYQYAVKLQDNSFRIEFGQIRNFVLSTQTNTILIKDKFREKSEKNPFESIAFKEIFFLRKKKTAKKGKKPTISQGNLILNLYNPEVEPEYLVAIMGNQDFLGNWDTSKKITLNDEKFPLWSVNFDVKEIKFPFEYKYVLVNSKTDDIVAWEGGENRILNQININTTTILTDENFHRTIPSWKTAGVAIPVFSLRSEESFGTGDFYDLKKLVDWAKITGQHFIQILPINDTILYHSNYDSYPYNAVSVYALHPIYLRLEELGDLDDKETKSYFALKKKKLNKNPFSDYQNVLNEKWKYFLLIYNKNGKKLFATKEYQTFFEENKNWLIPYAVFSFLRDKNGTPNFSKWKEFQTYNAEEVEKLADKNSKSFDEIGLYYFLQFHLHKQLIEVRDYAHSKGIALKSDVPIGVSPRSVDAWVEPTLFNTSMQAGAPPDDFSVTGQNWGFPTYNWDKMAEDGYLWWKNRFQKFVEYFDAYRIDHILGFFRIWEIPQNDVWGLTGSFNPSLPFSISEIEVRGLRWNEERFLKPYLKEHVIRTVLGNYADDVMREYLVSDGWQSFRFKPEFDTQKKVEAHFALLGYNFTEKELIIRDGLYALHCEVLFLRDKRQPNKFNPRISIHSSHSFVALDEHSRRALDRIYIEYFYHRHNEFWKEQAFKKLPPIISATNMLVCGEDLGMVPESVPEVMEQLGLLSLEIQRMPKKTNTEFAMPSDAPYLSVCTTSTHDMNPIRAWWEENREITQRFYNNALHRHGEAPEKCTPEIAEEIIQQHLDSKAMLVILPWQDWMAIDDSLSHENPHAERINVPADPRNFWCYRMHFTLEKLLKEKKFNHKIKEMITSSGR